jgi:hypothetical protein
MTILEKSRLEDEVPSWNVFRREILAAFFTAFFWVTVPVFCATELSSPHVLYRVIVPVFCALLSYRPRMCFIELSSPYFVLHWVIVPACALSSYRPRILCCTELSSPQVVHHWVIVPASCASLIYRPRKFCITELSSPQVVHHWVIVPVWDLLTCVFATSSYEIRMKSKPLTWKFLHECPTCAVWHVCCLNKTGCIASFYFSKFYWYHI